MGLGVSRLRFWVWGCVSGARWAEMRSQLLSGFSFFLRCGSLVGVPFRILNILIIGSAAKPRQGTTIGTIGRVWDWNFR